MKQKTETNESCKEKLGTSVQKRFSFSLKILETTELSENAVIFALCAYLLICYLFMLYLITPLTTWIKPITQNS